MNEKTKLVLVCVGAFLLVLLIPAIPLITIACLNTLFGLEIPYTLKTWASAFFLAGMFSSCRLKLRKD